MTGLAQKNRDLYRRCDRFLAGEVLSSSTSGFPASKKQAVNINDRISLNFMHVIIVIKTVEFMPFSTKCLHLKNCQYFACFETESVAVNSPF